MATTRFLPAIRARKSNNPSHIDDWMYVKLAMLKINVNENRIRNVHSGGFLREMPDPGSSAPAGGPDRLCFVAEKGGRCSTAGWIQSARWRRTSHITGNPLRINGVA